MHVMDRWGGRNLGMSRGGGVLNWLFCQSPEHRCLFEIENYKARTYVQVRMNCERIFGNNTTRRSTPDALHARAPCVERLDAGMRKGFEVALTRGDYLGHGVYLCYGKL